MSICQCLLFGRFSNLEWVAMACLGTLVPGRVFLVLTGFADFVVLAPWAMKNILFFVSHLQFIRDFRDCFGFKTWYSSFGRMIL
jgi:hypothetical protein